VVCRENRARIQLRRKGGWELCLGARKRLLIRGRFVGEDDEGPGTEQCLGAWWWGGAASGAGESLVRGWVVWWCGGWRGERGGTGSGRHEDVTAIGVRVLGGS
jgi:hypothetical protein